LLPYTSVTAELIFEDLDDFGLWNEFGDLAPGVEKN
jgi:hypothetical protein